MAAPIGLDIGSSAVRATQLRQGRNGTSLERVGQVSLPTGAVRDGEIVQRDVVVAALKDLWKTAKFKGRKVSVGLANQQVVVRRLDLPYMTESELRTSLPLQVDGLIPIPADEAVLDFCYLGEHTSDDGERMVGILVVAALRSMVNELLAVVRQARLDPIGIDLDAFAALRSLTPPDVLADPDAELVVDIGGTVTDMVVHQNGSPRFVRTVLFGGQQLTTRLADRLDIDLDDAESLKLKLAHNGLAAATREDDVTTADTDAETDLHAADASPASDHDDGWSTKDADDLQHTGDDPDWSSGYDAGVDAADSDETADLETASGVGQPDAEADAADIVRGQTRRLIDEIKGSIDYCATQKDIPSIRRLVLTGGASQWPGLPDALADELSLDITTGSPLRMVRNGSGLADNELAAAAPHLAVAVGLALGAQQ